MKNQTTSSKTENAMKHLFWKCKEKENETIWDDVRDNNIKQIREDIKQLGSWPLADSDWNPDSFDLNGLLQKIPSITGQRKLDISFGIFQVSMPGARKLFIEPTYETYDVEIIEEVLTDVLGTPPGKSEVQDIDFFGHELKKIASYKAQNITIPIDDYSKVKSAIPDVDIDKLLQQLLSNNKAKWDKIKNQIYELNGFHQKAKLIQQLIRDHKRSAANYLIYKYAHTAYSYLSKIETKCHETVIENLPFPSIRVFVRNHFDKNAMKDVDTLVEDMKTNYIDLIENSEFLTEKTKKGAIQKMKSMKKTIAYPEEFEASGALDNIHAAIIDDPLFHTSFPKYAKIAGVGSIIGHEIDHAFGPTSVNFDENGNYKKWWDAQDLEKYENRSMCLVDQYEQYDDPHFGKNLNGTLTVNEIISDELGHDVAWRIFKKMDLSQEKKIIGFEDYSIEKLYFQIGATNYCAPRPQHTLREQLEDPHSTLSFRVNGVFSNKKEFAETFNSPVGSPMNPVKNFNAYGIIFKESYSENGWSG
ncbi:hypothetical protein B9Z55_007211 [Caenorhabditis nigoni]|uniref:Peptidase M13 C-terminal domain-containing protein n=1 Tax=Caenorhabditis nigoni TaxID=1611254 RepID=A0A2G5V8R8_9PELO|nr:hypothetical protein B9Z55_007211 [Caenorhabditis nigoni]